MRSGAGEQLGPVLQRPGQLPALSGSWRGGLHRAGHRRGVEHRVEGGQDIEQDLHRVRVVIGQAAMAAGPPLTVAGRDLAHVPADRAP